MTAAISSETAGASSWMPQPRRRWPQGMRAATSSSPGSGSGWGVGRSSTFTPPAPRRPQRAPVM